MDNDYLAKSEAEVEAFEKDYNSREHVCPVCGRIFHIPMYVSRSEYVYTISVRDKKSKKMRRCRCCSYSCYRRALNKSL